MSLLFLWSTFAYIKYDNLDKASFPTRGFTANVDFSWKDMSFTSKQTDPLSLGSLVFGFEGYVPIIENRLVGSRGNGGWGRDGSGVWD